MNTGDMEKYCPKPHPVYFNAFSMWQQLSGSVQYLINVWTYVVSRSQLTDRVRVVFALLAYWVIVFQFPSAAVGFNGVIF